MEVVIILILILLNGLFSMSEIALVSARKVRLEHQAGKGDEQAEDDADRRKQAGRKRRERPPVPTRGEPAGHEVDARSHDADRAENDDGHLP